jgi:hypothetical protein
MTLTLCLDTRCPQSSTCARYDEKNDKSKVHFTYSPRGPLGCLEYKRIKRADKTRK